MIDDISRIDRDEAPPAMPSHDAVLNESGPWGGGSGDGGGTSGGGGDGHNSWTQPPRKRPRRARAAGQPSIEELIRRGRARFGGHLPSGGGRPIWGYALAGFVLLWLATTSIHRIEPQERGVVTRFGRYAMTLQPGVGFTLPAPIDTVTRVNVDPNRSFDVPASGGEDLLLTSDQNLVNIAYTVRWSVRDPEQYLFQLATPEDVIRDIAQSAMREEVARVKLDEATGPLTSQIESRVAARTQALLDGYRAGVHIEEIAIKQADVPAVVADATKEVLAARQQAQSDRAAARADAQQEMAAADTAAGSFDKVYDAYKMAPEVTRRRMYYETMEAVLSKTDKVIVDTPGATPTFQLPMPAKKVPPPPPAAAPAPAAPQGGGQ